MFTTGVANESSAGVRQKTGPHNIHIMPEGE